MRTWREREIGLLHDEPVLFEPPVILVELPLGGRHPARLLQPSVVAQLNAARPRVDVPYAPLACARGIGFDRVMITS